MFSEFGKKKKKTTPKKSSSCEKSTGLTKEQASYLEVKPSTVKAAGKGLFAKKDIPKGTKLGYYAGKYMNEKAYDKLKNQDYVWEIKKDLFVDAKPCPKATLRFINGVMKGQSKKINVEPYSYANKLWYRTTKNIKKGSELWIDYGDEYWI